MHELKKTLKIIRPYTINVTAAAAKEQGYHPQANFR